MAEVQFSEGTPPLILKLDTRLNVRSQLHSKAALLPAENPRYPFYRRLGGPQPRSGQYAEGNTAYHCRESNHNSWVVQPVTSLDPMRYSDSGCNNYFYLMSMVVTY